MPEFHLYIHQPVAIFKARVNMPGTITYPLASLTFDTVTLGAYTDIEFDMLLTLGTTEGADDLGRVRVTKTATSTVVYIGRASKGLEDGTLVVQDNAYITVWEDYRPWAKIPYFDLDNGIDYKDGDVEPGTFLTDIPPVANTGPGFADYIDPLTGLITVQFPGGGVDLSYAMADGATIATYAWEVGDGTITVGTSASAVITATFPAGFRYVKLTVVDSNDVAHSARCPVLAVDPDDDVTQPYYRIRQQMQIKGQSLTIELLQDLARSTYQDGSLVLFWWDSAADESDREHMKFVGWLDTEQSQMGRQRQGYSRKTTLTALDVNLKLEKLPGFPQALSRIEDESPWSYMPSLDMNKSLHYLLFWHSTAVNLADFILPSDGDDYNAMRLDASGGSLFAQVNSQAEKMVPDHHLTCNTKGQMVVRRNWMYDDEADRPEASPVLTEELWNNLSYEYNRHPKVHVLRSGAILSSTALDADDEIPLVFSVAPGEAQAFGQGTAEQSENEGLALSQDDLNACEGHRYALLNSRYGEFSFEDPTGFIFWSYEPAMLYRVGLNIEATYAAQRGLSWTSANGLVKSINVQYSTDKRGTSVKASVTWQKEEFGYPASTYIPEDAEDVDYTPPVPAPFVPNDPNNPDEFYGDIAAYILWDGQDVVRTWDLQAGSPTWENISSGQLSGTIIDCQYMMVDADTVGAWLLTSTNLYYCADIMATSPVWTNKLTITDVRATAVAPTSGNVVFGGMTHYWSQPGHLCIAMSLDTENDDYLHSYYWVTEDYGATWTDVDHTSDTFTSDSATRCYYFADLYSINSFRTSPGTIWCVRGNGRTSINGGDGAVFISSDLGYTWTKGAVLADGRISQQGALLNPYPDATDPSYLQILSGGITPSGKMYVSTDGWSTATQLTEPASHQGSFNSVSSSVQRPNKNPFDDLHILALFQIDASSNADLYESNDGGTNWTLLKNLNNSVITPNGWPPDPDQWVLIDHEDTPHIQLTLDNFANMLDKTGNLATVLTGSVWTQGRLEGGFALPRVGTNDPGFPFPAWGTYDSTTSVLTYHGRTLQRTVSQGSGDDGNVSSWLMIYPPDDIVRVRIEGTYALSYTKGPSFTDGFAIFELDTPANVTMTTDVTGDSVSAPENGSASGSFYVEFELASGSWPTSAEDAEASTPTGHAAPFLRAWCFSSDPDIVTSATITAKVVEMETSGAVIYEY